MMGQPTANGAGRARTQGIVRSARVWLAASQGCCRSYSHVTYPPPVATLASLSHRQKAYLDPWITSRSSPSLNKVRAARMVLPRSIFHLESFRYGSLNISKLGSVLTLIRSEARGTHSLARGLCPLRVRGSMEHLIRTRSDRYELLSRARARARVGRTGASAGNLNASRIISIRNATTGRTTLRRVGSSIPMFTYWKAGQLHGSIDPRGGSTPSTSRQPK